MDDGHNASRRGRLIWSIRWLAADPEATLGAVEDPRTVPDEIAEDFDHWLEVCRHWDLIDDPVLDILETIDQTFQDMSGIHHADQWTPEALTTSEAWAVQRTRAREALTMLGEERADEDLRGHVA
jgi:hypothetical protein